MTVLCSAAYDYVTGNFQFLEMSTWCSGLMRPGYASKVSCAEFQSDQHDNSAEFIQKCDGSKYFSSYCLGYQIIAEKKFS